MIDKIKNIKDSLDNDFKIVIKEEEEQQDIFLLYEDNRIAKLQYVEGSFFYDMEITKDFNDLDLNIQQKALKAIVDIGEILKKEL